MQKKKTKQNFINLIFYIENAHSKILFYLKIIYINIVLNHIVAKLMSRTEYKHLNQESIGIKKHPHLQYS